MLYPQAGRRLAKGTSPLQSSEDQFTFKGLELSFEAGPLRASLRYRGTGKIQRRRNLAATNFTHTVGNHQPLHQIFQLSDVARPVILG